jgi:saccharopine dehydrogenase (NAD+, L-lysine forming)
MRVLLVGVGGVGEAIAVTARGRPWLETMVLADYDLARARHVGDKLGHPGRFPVEQVDAADQAQVERLARKHRVDLVMNAVTCEYNTPIFEAAFAAGCTYIDMAMADKGANMGRAQFDGAARWEERRLLAILGMGMDPGVSNVFARYAEKHLFDEIDEIGIRDGAALTVAGLEFAPTFSIYDTLEECTDPPLVWEADRGWFDVEPFSEPEVFDFPEGIGPIECVNIEHDEVVMIPRWVRCRRVTFKYGLGETFINVIKVIKMLGLHGVTPIDVKGVMVKPVDVIAALLPNPAELGDRMTGKTCVGTLVTGTRAGRPRKVYLYQSTDNAESMGRYGCQAVSWQTGVGPVIAMELLATGAWKGTGVLCPEAFDPDPFLALMPQLDFPWRMVEMEPGME